METLFENEIAIVACVKNESPYVGEWIEYHHRIGIDKFYIYDNDSEDRAELLRVLDPWIESKIVDYVEFPGSIAQIPSYVDALEKHRFDCRYMGFIDIDEFIVPKQNRDLIDILDATFKLSPPPQTKIAALGINWRTFGSNGQDRKLPGGVIERFTKRAPDDLENNHHVKVIVNPRRVNRTTNPHNVIFYLNNICVDENGLNIPLYHNPRNTVEKIQINHYYTKSREEYNLKLSRGRADVHSKYDPKMFDDYQHDEIEDLTALTLFNEFFQFHRINDEQSTIRDLKFMLGEKKPNIELLLTCFHRAHALKDQSQSERFENESLEKLLKIQVIQLDEAQLFVDTLPELLKTSTQYRDKIVNRGIELFNMLEGFMRQKILYFDQFDFQRRRDLLELLR